MLANIFLVFHMLLYFTRLKAHEISCKIWETRKIFPILHLKRWHNNYLLYEASCNNYFIVKCFLKSNVARVILLHQACLIWFNANLVEAKTTSTSLTWLHFYLHISIPIFCTLPICFVHDGLLQSICFWMFCSKHSITFEKTYLLS